MSETFVIVGAGLAGGRAAETLRQEGFQGRVVLVGEEPERPYERPPLSKELLAGGMDEEQVYLRPPGYYAEQAIELWTGAKATRLDAETRTLWLADGRRLRYDRLLLATGAAARLPRVPGAGLDGVLTLRTLADARALRARLAAARRVVVVGSGFIGTEVAATARRLGLEVILLGSEPWPLARAFGAEVGRRIADLHRAHGVVLHGGERVAAFRGQRALEQVVTASGLTLDAELAVVGVGVDPAVDWLRGSGLELDDGIVVDELCRASLPGVYAAGDVARFWHPTLGERLRLEHFDHAQHQGVAAARSMLDNGEPYAPLPFFWSDQFEQSLQYVGYPGQADEVVVRGAAESRSWSAYYLRAGYARAALLVDRPAERTASRALITRRIPVTAAQLADERCDLRALALEAAAR